VVIQIWNVSNKIQNFPEENKIGPPKCIDRFWEERRDGDRTSAGIVVPREGIRWR
jgi:hypothetical protein